MRNRRRRSLAQRSRTRRWLASASLLLLIGCPETQPPEGPPTPTAADPIAVLFAERASELGIDFSYRNGMNGNHYLLEVMGGGVATFDYDNDGDLDLYAVQGRALDAATGEGPSDRLFRNDLAPGPDGEPVLAFSDVTEASGLDANGYGMGVAVADYDNDGWVDLYVTNWGANQLWRNNGPDAQGVVTFSDVTLASGAGDDRWSVSAVFFDYDRDGFLDLYIGNYVDFQLAKHKTCIGFGATEDYCGPSAYPAQPDRLLRNLGPDASGRVSFADVTTESGLSRETGPALGAVAADFDSDGWLDLYVANDQSENFLWINRLGTLETDRGGVAFTNEALLSGCALSGEGKTQASMGVDAGDFDGDGDLDLVLAHLTGESHTLYANDGSGTFEDATVRSGLSAPSWDATGFGARFLDYDLDGWLDLIVTTGAVHRIEALALRGDPYPLGQTNQLFRNRGNGVFEEVSDRAGANFQLAEVSRGAAIGDLDNDGAPDVVIANSEGPLRVLVNEHPGRSSWLGLRLVAAAAQRDLLGALVSLRREGRPTLVRRVATDGSYASASDPRVVFGLGAMPATDHIEVRWPDGVIETWSGVPIDRYTTIARGSGERVE